MTHITKVYKDKGGDRQVIESGGELLLKTGAVITNETGDDVYVDNSADAHILLQLISPEVSA